MFGLPRLYRIVTEVALTLAYLQVVAAQIFHTYNQMEYGERLKEMVKAAEKTIAVESTWHQISKDFPRIMGTTQSLYWSIQTNIIDNFDDAMVISSAYALRQELQRNLILRNGEMLSNSMSLDGAMLKKTLPKIRDHLMRSYELEVVQDIFTKAIDELYYLKGVEHLSNALELITLGTSNCDFLELYVHSRLHLLRKFMMERDVNEPYMLNEAHCMQNLRNKNLSPGTERRLEIAIASLPNATVSVPKDFRILPLVRVTGGDTFCLKNVQNNSYVYMPKVPQETSYYTLLKDSPVFNGTQWQLHNKTEYDGKHNRVQYAFFNPYTKQYLYLETEGHTKHGVFGRYGHKIYPNKGYWQMKTKDDKLVFHQKGLYFCASQDIHRKSSKTWFGVYGLNDKKYTDKNPACQWVAERCPFY